MRRTDLLFHAGGECLQQYGTLVRRVSRETDDGYTFTRTGANAWARGHAGVYLEAAANIPRVGWSTAPGLLVEVNYANEVFDSADVDVDNSANWSESAAWTQADVTSLIAGENAVQYTSDGVTTSHAVFHTIGSTFPAGAVVASIIVENVDATRTDFGIYDNTVGDWVNLARYTWATDSIVSASSGVGSSVGVRSRIITESGPNGGRVVELQAYGTPDNSGNTPRLYIYPTSTNASSLGAIVHHAQYSEGSTVGSSPIVTAGAAVTRNAETFYADTGFAPQALSAYVKFLELGSAFITTAGIIHIGAASGGSDPRFDVYRMGSGRYRVEYDNGTAVTNADITAGNAVSYGDDVELLVTLAADGGVSIAQSVNGGAVTTAVTGAAPSGGLASTWAADRLYIGSSGSSAQGIVSVESVKIARGVRAMAEMRAV